MADPGKPLTSEKRLLKIIEESEADPKVKSSSFGLSFLKSQARALLSFRPGKDMFRRGASQLSLAQVRTWINLVAVVMAVVFAGSIFLEMREFNRQLQADLLAPVPKVNEKLLKKEMDEMPVFEAVKVKNVFIPFEIRAEDKVQKPTGQSGEIIALAKSLKLTGLSYNPEDPEKAFCMIEDLEKGITNFLRTGDSVNGLKVAAIKEDNVTLEWNQETIEIR